MARLTSQNIESELSYAYLHAIASACGMACEICGRHEDNAGADARIIAWSPFENGGYRTEIELKVQLKATIKTPAIIDDCFSYSFQGISRYDDLRKDSQTVPRILVVLFLPKEPEQWIEHGEDALLLRKCAYWVSLRGAGESANETSQTVYIPRSQRFDVPGLNKLIGDLSRDEIPSYAALENRS
ncbi:DUF4365 domain-containing protein [Rhizobium sp.]|uniref:DUF4365 domain-containing protein n=1 Tax=Rhizobium sp. TaxID=391 RepID=UPI0028AEB1A9